MTSKRFARRLLTAGLLTACAPALAHFPWIAADVDDVDAPFIEVHFGHGPGDATPLPAERLDTITSLDARGAAQTLTPDNPAQTRFTLTADAVAVAVIQQPGYWSPKSGGGGERRPRSDVPDAESCVYSRNSLKAMLDFSAVATGNDLGHPLEITLDALSPDDDALQLRVRFLDAPYTGRLSLIGVSPEARPALFDGDDQGRFTVPRPDAGRWMLYARTTTPYPDTARCDQNGYNATLVLDIPKR